MRWVVLVLVAACSSGGGEEDTGGGDGDGPGDATAPVNASGLVWVDANGDVVPGATEYGGEPAYVDGSGYVWSLEPWTGEAGPWRGENSGPAVLYADEGCTEPAYLVSRLDQPPLVVLENNERVAFVVLPNARITLARAYTDLGSDGACEPYSDDSEEDEMIRVSDTVEVTPPAVPGAPPFHPEP